MTIKLVIKLKIEVETDKRVNVNALWSGKQILLCKKMQKMTLINEEGWVGLWPTKSGESQMKNRDLPVRSVDFALSGAGYHYFQNIYNEYTKNKYIAKVEYYQIDGTQLSLWQDLKDADEFILWDIELGPYKYFKSGKRKNFLAIYRVYEIDNEIKESDIRDRNNILPRNKKLSEEKSQKIINNLSNAKPVLSDSEFDERKNKILKIIENYRPMVFKNKIFNKIELTKIDTTTKDFEEIDFKPNSLENKYCIFCGVELPYEAIYCYRCGREQHVIQ